MYINTVVLVLMTNYMKATHKKSGRKRKKKDLKLQVILWINAACNTISILAVMVIYLTEILNSVDKDGESFDKYLLITIFPISAIFNPILLTLVVTSKD